MKKLQLNFLVFLIISLFLLQSEKANSQILISNSTGSPDPSAMMEIQSDSKGLLIPRLTTAQRTTLTTSAKEGLLVYDSDIKAFFIYGKDSKGSVTWYNISSNAGLWSQEGNAVYLSNTTYNVGIGTASPDKKKLVIKAQNATDTLLEIQDMNGAPIMVITPSLTKFNIIKGNKGTAGGFAVGRYSLAKAAVDSNLFVVTPDSTRVYTGTAGGFAVGRYSLAKGTRAKYFFTNIDSTRIYTDGSGVKGTAGGFAVGRYSLAKGTKAGTDKFMHITEGNAFIGLNAGINTTTGTDNVFIGNSSGLNNLTGTNNVYIGNSAGSNAAVSSSAGNIFIGNSAGISETGNNKLYISNNASDSNGALIYGDFSSGSESVNLNGNLRFNRGTNTITMPTVRGNANEVLTTGAGGTTNWENVNNLVTFPPSYQPPITVITYENNFPLQDNDNIGTLIVKTTEGEMNTELPSVEANNGRIITIKNNRNANTINVRTIDPDIIEGIDKQPFIIEEGETYTFQAGVDKNTGETVWYIIDYTVDNQLKNLLKTTKINYNFNSDVDGKRVYTLIITDPVVDKIILPTAAGNKNRIVVIKNATQEAKGISVTPAGTDLIDGSNTPAILNNPGESYMLQSDGIKNWYIINHYLQ